MNKSKVILALGLSLSTLAITNINNTNNAYANAVNSEYKIETNIKTYLTAYDAKNKTNAKSEYQTGNYHIYKESNGMLNISKEKGKAGAWINPEENKKETTIQTNKVEENNKNEKTQEIKPIQTGWIKEGNFWYYKNSQGQNVRNQWIGNYYLKADEKMAVSEWIYDNNYKSYYYVDENGVYVRNKWINGYYLKEDGKMAKNEWIYDNDYESYYYLKDSGIYAINHWQGDYYLKADGKMAISEWIYDRDYESYYYLNSSGAYARNSWLDNYYLKADGKMAVSEWIYDNYYKAYYYLDTNGVYVKNTWIGNYYLKADGKMAVSEWTPDGYYVDHSGKWDASKKRKFRNPINVGNLGQYSDKRFPWSWSHPARDGLNLLESNSGLYKYYTNNKELYLTFDNGYEAGYTSSILDTLKNNNVKAVFFVTGTYIRDNLDLVKRMENEGHIVANHTLNHYSASNTDAWTITKDIKDWENSYISYMGKEPITNLYRPATGAFSERTIKGAMSHGYKLVLWSYAHKDWEPHNQPPVTSSRNKMINTSKPGDIILLHSISRTNKDLLDGYIKEMHARGYTFKLIN